MLSRVADNLFWMSRYLERAEHSARLLDVHLNSTLDMASGLVEQHRLHRLQASLALTNTDLHTAELLHELTFDASNPASISALIASARENARQVRQQLSSEMWMQINKLYLHVRDIDANNDWRAAPHEYYLTVRDGSHLFQGITDATMNHNQGWHFIQLGRYIERSVSLLRLLDVQFHTTNLTIAANLPTERYFELTETLKSVTAFEAYTKVYSPNVQPKWVVEFLLFNREFPHSLRFCVEMIQTSLDALAEMAGRSRNSRLYRVAGRLQSRLNYDEMSDVDALHGYAMSIQQQIFEINDLLYKTYITYPIEAEL